ncbi:MAG: hypothetical protein MPJ78_15825 [Hyphomicrobiaceae bacterium]|nr:hypothetical protein [Hyphomicrobiaceae bacterium]
MERLIDNALIYGSMVHVDQPHLVERYNHALEALGIAKTKRPSFSIDATGFSPEIADDLDDVHYLDPMGVNRRFIIVSPEQAQHPVVNINFSSTIDFMRKFYERNAEAIKILTLKDVIYGEIENSTYSVNDIDDVLSIKRAKFRLHTHNQLLEKARELTTLVNRFKAEEESWKDNALLNAILALAKECGDTRYNRIVPRQLNFAANSFWTRHFGGVYVFHDEDDATVVIGSAKQKELGSGKRGQDRFIPLRNYREVLQYLQETSRIEPLNLKWLDGSGLLDMRFDLFVRNQISEREPEREIASMTEIEVKNWVHDNLSDLNGMSGFKLLSNLRNAALHRSAPQQIKLPAQAQLMVSRADPEHSDYQLVNRFLSEYVPFDFLMRFIVNKHSFYRDYETWNDNKKDHAVGVITSVFFPDKQALWESFFEDWRLVNA